MPNEYIHYIKREIITDYPKDIAAPWFSVPEAYEKSLESPVYHITRSASWPATAITEGDIIWLVGQLFSPWGKLPPSIDARIEVESVEKIQVNDEKSKLKYLASKNSNWFPLRDASDLFSKLQVVSKTRAVSIPYVQEKDNLGAAFRSMKKIYEPSEINQFAKSIESSPLHFISYRIVDGTMPAFFKVRSLLADGCSVFWDRWSLPRRLAERRERVSDAALDLLLNKKIQQADVVWGIETLKYSEADSYSAKEEILATSLKKYQPVRRNA